MLVEDDMVMEWPQSGERFVGRANVLAAMGAVEVKPEFAGQPRLIGSGHVWVLMVPFGTVRRSSSTSPCSRSRTAGSSTPPATGALRSPHRSLERHSSIPAEERSKTATGHGCGRVPGRGHAAGLALNDCQPSRTTMKLTIRAATASAHQRPSTPYAARLTRLNPCQGGGDRGEDRIGAERPTRHPGSDPVLGDRKRREHQNRGDQQDGPDRRRPWMILGGERPKTTDDQVRGQDKQRQPDRPLRGLLDAVGSMRLARFIEKRHTRTIDANASITASAPKPSSARLPVWAAVKTAIEPTDAAPTDAQRRQPERLSQVRGSTGHVLQG